MKKFKLSSIFNSIFKRKNDVLHFKTSKQYWENRYKIKKTSGSGSYGRLSEFKAEVLNDFVLKNAIDSVLEYGCGDGNQLLLAKYPNYIGVDVSKTAVEICESLFKSDDTKTFYHKDEFDTKNKKASLVLSLDVIYHLLEDDVFYEYMTSLFKNSTKYVIIYSSNYDEHSDKHVRSRKFTNWIDKNVSEQWKLDQFIKNIYPFDKSNRNQTSMADFYIYKNCN